MKTITQSLLFNNSSLSNHDKQGYCMHKHNIWKYERFYRLVRSQLEIDEIVLYLAQKKTPWLDVHPQYLEIAHC